MFNRVQQFTEPSSEEGVIFKYFAICLTYRKSLPCLRRSQFHTAVLRVLEAVSPEQVFFSFSFFFRQKKSRFSPKACSPSEMCESLDFVGDIQGKSSVKCLAKYRRKIYVGNDKWSPRSILKACRDPGASA